MKHTAGKHYIFMFDRTWRILPPIPTYVLDLSRIDHILLNPPQQNIFIVRDKNNIFSDIVIPFELLSVVLYRTGWLRPTLTVKQGTIYMLHPALDRLLPGPFWSSTQIRSKLCALLQ